MIARGRRALASLFCLFLVAGILVLAAGGALAKTKIQVALRFGSVEQWNGVFVEIANEYMRRNPDVEIELLANWNDDKIFTAAAGGVLPDIINGSGASERHREILLPLDELMERAGIKPEDFLPGALAQMRQLGQIWTLQYIIDPNFPLIYNKTLFMEAGLDPERPPATVQELDEVYAKLVRRDAQGLLTQIPIVPWNDLSPAQAAASWGRAFGAYEWEGSDAEGRFTLTSDRWLAMFEWMKSYYNQYHGDYAGSIMGRGGSSGARDRMRAGQQAMMYWVTSEFNNLRETAPMYEFGVAPPIYEEEYGLRYPFWWGGHRMGVTRTSKNPEIAFDFLAFLATSPEAQIILARNADLLPATVGSPGFQEIIQKTPEFAPVIYAIQGTVTSPPNYFLSAGPDWTTVFRRIFDQGESPQAVLAQEQERLEALAREAGVIIR